MSDEFARNGYANWDAGYEILSAFLVSHLTDGTFGPQTSAGVKKDIEMVTRYARREKVDHDLEEAHMRLQEAVVAWCNRHPALVAHATNPNLKR